MNVATKHLRTVLVKENTREFRLGQARSEERKKAEYGKVVVEVAGRQRSDQIRRLEQRRRLHKVGISPEFLCSFVGSFISM